ncbi:hypothetical protein [Streptomyces tagetis]|uniref:Uncharacterized protein n=1 Tax=Streptomyces tagetis TaxID=2820809 RepID=A0A940XGI9_9ACTN|nr:hypothetical protein [Streptomyces sp. RG38]MBQ0828019.1 hypothetical protein [Streptomyces sp. RG38]
MLTDPHALRHFRHAELVRQADEARLAREAIRARRAAARARREAARARRAAARESRTAARAARTAPAGTPAADEPRRRTGTEPPARPRAPRPA